LCHLHDMEIWTDAGEVGWGGHTIDNMSVSGQFEAKWIGSSSTARELRGLFLTMSAMSEQLEGRIVRLNMDSMCSARNIIKGGGPVQQLCTLVQDIWRLVQTVKN